MDETIKLEKKTPIELALDLDDSGRTTARKLYAWLERRPQDYSRWARQYITENEFATEGVDYSAIVRSENNHRGNFAKDYRLTSSFAKKLAMVDRSKKGEEARDYFIRVEKTLVSIATESQSPKYATKEEIDKKFDVIFDCLSTINNLVQTVQMAIVNNTATVSAPVVVPTVQTYPEIIDAQSGNYDSVISERVYPVTISVIAKDYEMTAVKLNKILAAQNVQYKWEGVWTLCSEFADKNYTQEFVYTNWATGEQTRSHKWTKNGNEFIYKLLKEHLSIVPTCERK